MPPRSDGHKSPQAKPPGPNGLARFRDLRAGPCRPGSESPICPEIVQRNLGPVCPKTSDYSQPSRAASSLAIWGNGRTGELSELHRRRLKQGTGPAAELTKKPGNATGRRWCRYPFPGVGGESSPPGPRETGTARRGGNVSSCATPDCAAKPVPFSRPRVYSLNKPDTERSVPSALRPLPSALCPPPSQETASPPGDPRRTCLACGLLDRPGA